MENDLHGIKSFLLTVLLILVEWAHQDLVFEWQLLVFIDILWFTRHDFTLRHCIHLIIILIVALSCKVSSSDLQISCLISYMPPRWLLSWQESFAKQALCTTKVLKSSTFSFYNYYTAISFKN